MKRMGRAPSRMFGPPRLMRGGVVLATAALAIGCSRSVAPVAACTDNPLDVAVALGVVYQSPSDSTMTAKFT